MQDPDINEFNLNKQKDSHTFEAKFYGIDGNKTEITTEKQANEIINSIKSAKFSVSDVKQGEKKRNPAPPFTTSTMQQEASRKLNFAIRKTMQVAQRSL